MDKELILDLINYLEEDIQEIIDQVIRVNNCPLYRLKEELIDDEYSVKNQLKKVLKDAIEIRKQIKKGE